MSEKKELDYTLISKCMLKSEYDVKKRTVSKKRVKNKVVNIINDENTKEVIAKFNKCVEDSDDTTENSNATEIKDIASGKVSKISDIVPKSIENLKMNATFSIIGGIVLGKALKLGTLGIITLIGSMIVAMSFNDARRVKKSVDNIGK